MILAALEHRGSSLSSQSCTRRSIQRVLRCIGYFTRLRDRSPHPAARVLALGDVASQAVEYISGDVIDHQVGCDCLGDDCRLFPEERRFRISEGWNRKTLPSQTTSDSSAMRDQERKRGAPTR